MQALDNILKTATLAIDKGFIEFRVAGDFELSPIYRERVYCYELYHQMRCGWDAVSEGYTLNGEVDKRGSKFFSGKSLKNRIPDLLVHRPGFAGAEANHAVIEVKSGKVEVVEMTTDIKKLDAFVDLAGYSRAIFLIYASGETRDQEWIDGVDTIISDEPIKSPIELWLHRCPNTPAECVKTHAP